MDIFISSLDNVYNTIFSRGITHVLTLLTLEEREHLRIPGFFDRINWLYLEMDDVIDCNIYNAPTKDQIDYILNWGRRLPKNARLLVHCFGGVSRSTATALALKVQDNGIYSIDESIKWLIEHRPSACPNSIIIKYADELLNANGKLLQATENLIKRKLIDNKAYF